MSSGAFFQEMLVLYSIGLIGFIARKREIMNEHAIHSLTQLILSLTLPFLILYSMGRPYQLEAAGVFFWLIPISVLILILSVLLAIFLRRQLQVPEDRKSAVEGLIIFCNQGFIGFALLTSLFPEYGALYVSLYNLPYLILIWTYGIYLFAGSKGNIPWKQLLFNPGILATWIGMVVFLSPYHWPRMVSSVLEMVGNTTIPLSMLLIGALLAHVNFKQTVSILKDKILWMVTAARLIIIPGLLFPLLLFPLPFPLLATAVLVSATPAAPTMALYAKKYGGDTDYAAFGSAWTTLLSVVTIPSLYILLYAGFSAIQ
jgi:hypothetical protein